MAKKVDIGPTIGVDGEKEFQNQLKKVNAAVNLLGSEMKIVTAEFGKNATSEEALTKQNDVLERSILTLQEKLELQTKKLQETAENYKEDSVETMKWQEAVNKTTAEIAKAERQLNLNNDALDEMANAEAEAADNTEESTEKLEENAEANEKAADAEEKHTVSLGKVAAALGAMAAAAGAAAVALAKNVISSFGELEQNLGGAEAVFGDYADTIVEKSDYAYRNLGVSSSEYLATANKIGALFQGTGVEQERSLELTTAAMQRAADMASVMGINTEDALNAITGAAKGNYTMMDNLGVAMNNTALETYAADKGFDKLFKDMSNAEKAEVAMQYFFENTEQYAGNFAKESAGTIQGALGMFNSAKENLIAGLGNADADIGMLAQQLMFSISKVVENVTPVLSNIASALPGVVESLIPALQTMLPKLINAGMELFQAVLDGMLKVLPDLADLAVDIIAQLTGSLLNELPTLIAGAVAIIIALAEGMTEVLPELVPVAVDAVLTIVNALIDNVGLLVDSAIAIIFALADGLIASLPTLIEQAPTIVQKLVDAIIENAPKLLTSALELILKLVEGIIDNLPEIGTATVELVGTILKGIADSFVKFVEAGGDIVKGIIEGIDDWFDWAWRKIKEWFGNVLAKVKDFLGIHSPSTVFANIGSMMAEGVGEGWDDEFGAVSRDINDSFASLLPDSTANIGVMSSMSGSGMRSAMADSVNAMSMMQSANANTGNLNITIQTDGREFYRATLKDFRLINSQNPIILNDF